MDGKLKGQHYVEAGDFIAEYVDAAMATRGREVARGMATAASMLRNEGGNMVRFAEETGKTVRDETIKYTADVVLLNESMQVLLVKRKGEPFAGMWALPGGHVDKGETAERAARRELFEETGVDLEQDEFKFVVIADDPDRDPRGRYVGAVFLVVAGGDVQPVAGDDAAEAKFWPLTSLPELAFDHNKIIGRVSAGLVMALLRAS